MKAVRRMGARRKKLLAGRVWQGAIRGCNKEMERSDYLAERGKGVDEVFGLLVGQLLARMVSVGNAADWAEGAVSHLEVVGGVAHYERVLCGRPRLLQNTQNHIRRRLLVRYVLFAQHKAYVARNVEPVEQPQQGGTAPAAGHAKLQAFGVEVLERFADVRKEPGLLFGYAVEQVAVGVAARLNERRVVRASGPTESLVQWQTNQLAHAGLRELWQRKCLERGVESSHDAGSRIGQRAVEV